MTKVILQTMKKYFSFYFKCDLHLIKTLSANAFVDFVFFLGGWGGTAEVNADFSNQNGMIYSNPAMV